MVFGLNFNTTLSTKCRIQRRSFLVKPTFRPAQLAQEGGTANAGAPLWYCVKILTCLTHLTFPKDVTAKLLSCIFRTSPT